MKVDNGYYSYELNCKFLLSLPTGAAGKKLHIQHLHITFYSDDESAKLLRVSHLQTQHLQSQSNTFWTPTTSELKFGC